MMREIDVLSPSEINVHNSKQRKSSTLTSSTAGSTFNYSSADTHPGLPYHTSSRHNNNESPSRKMSSSRGDARSRRNMSKESRKQLLMTLVKNEMMTAWEGMQEEDEDASTSLPSVNSASVNDELQKVSSADMFYAMMNGEQLSPAGPAKSRRASVGGYGGYGGAEDDKTDNTFDQPSFADLVFSPDDMISPVSRRQSATYGNKGSVNSLALLKSVDGGLDISNHDSQPSQANSHPSQHTGSDGLSVREIEEFVMANMPEHVRNQIPREAWGQIFGRTKSERTMESKFDFDEMMAQEEMEESTDKFDDNLTSVSDITEPTHFFESRSLRRPPSSPGAPPEAPPGVPPGAPGNRRNTRWESDDSPPELMPTGWSSDSHSGGEESPAQQRSPVRVEPSNQAHPAVKLEKAIKETESKVSFDNVQVRYYERILDVNPAVTNGAAIGIGWRYKRGGSLTVDEWEERKGGETRRANELLLPKHVRESMLKDLGYSQNDIAGAVRDILKCKNRRKQTVQNLGAEPMEQAVEAARKKVKNILALGMKKGLIKSKA